MASENKERVVARRRRRDAAELLVPEIEAALIASRGVIKKAAGKLACDRRALNKRILEDEYLDEIRKEAFAQFVDEVEDDYFDLMVKEKDKVRQIFFLKCHGKERGWVERQEVTGKDGEPLGQVVAPVRQMNAEEWSKENLKVVG